jgi:hypothetical protein
VDVTKVEMAARQKIEEILDFLVAQGHREQVHELREQMQILVGIKWEAEHALIKIRNSDGKCA